MKSNFKQITDFTFYAYAMLINDDISFITSGHKSAKFCRLLYEFRKMLTYQSLHLLRSKRVAIRYTPNDLVLQKTQLFVKKINYKN